MQGIRSKFQQQIIFAITLLNTFLNEKDHYFLHPIYYSFLCN